ncbi:MAG: hypothetical protein E6G67_12985 [Actinobacteria bacterium]|nr:MAG: hypothetical protein E6G67_12985 [Actinomycetota bacterium]
MTTRNLLAELATVRAQLVACDQEREAIEHAPVPITEALARANREVDEVLAGWNPNAFFRRYHLPQMPSRPPSSLRILPNLVDWRATPVEVFAVPDFERFLVALLEPAFRQFITDGTKAAAPAGEAIATADRAKRLAALAKKRRALEVEEEQIIMRAEIAGITGVYRRGDADPDIVLNTRLEDAA